MDPLLKGGGDGAGVVQVEIENLAFGPSEITIDVGKTIRWINRDEMPHTATSGDPEDEDAGSLWDSGVLAEGETFEHTFNEAGTFRYFCDFHPMTMRDALVIVQDD
jgi:plastocyanin